ncbi:hypothetical protein MIR68_006361 [Amoeboaphelidium protococcarum]|nr:hypothetical protein MIR68_006361 [Amoeboaphelidium protococcarum]
MHVRLLIGILIICLLKLDNNAQTANPPAQSKAGPVQQRQAPTQKPAQSVTPARRAQVAASPQQQQQQQLPRPPASGQSAQPQMLAQRQAPLNASVPAQDSTVAPQPSADRQSGSNDNKRVPSQGPQAAPARKIANPQQPRPVQSTAPAPVAQPAAADARPAPVADQPKAPEQQKSINIPEPVVAPSEHVKPENRARSFGAETEEMKGQAVGDDKAVERLAAPEATKPEPQKPTGDDSKERMAAADQSVQEETEAKQEPRKLAPKVDETVSTGGTSSQLPKESEVKESPPSPRQADPPLSADGNNKTETRPPVAEPPSKPAPVPEPTQLPSPTQSGDDQKPKDSAAQQPDIPTPPLSGNEASNTGSSAGGLNGGEQQQPAASMPVANEAPQGQVAAPLENQLPQQSQQFNNSAPAQMAQPPSQVQPANTTVAENQSESVPKSAASSDASDVAQQDVANKGVKEPTVKEPVATPPPPPPPVQPPAVQPSPPQPLAPPQVQLPPPPPTPPATKVDEKKETDKAQSPISQPQLVNQSQPQDSSQQNVEFKAASIDDVDAVTGQPPSSQVIAERIKKLPNQGWSNFRRAGPQQQSESGKQAPASFGVSSAGGLVKDEKTGERKRGPLTITQADISGGSNHCTISILSASIAVLLSLLLL